MLQNYNFDIMKIDMSFVRQIETNAKTRSIIRFIIEMAHTMDIKIIAEGAETKEQDRKSTRLNSSHSAKSRMPSSA